MCRWVGWGGLGGGSVAGYGYCYMITSYMRKQGPLIFTSLLTGLLGEGNDDVRKTALHIMANMKLNWMQVSIFTFFSSHVYLLSVYFW